MNREFLLNLLFLITVNLIIKPFYVFGIDLKVQHEVDNYSLYFALLNVSYIFQIFSDLGIQQYNNRNLSQHNYLFDKYFSHILGLKAGLALLFLVLSFISALFMGYRSSDLYLLLFLLFNQIFITFTFFFRSNISGLQHYRLDSLLSVLDKLLLILICVPLLWGPWVDQFKIEWFVYAQSTAFGLTAMIAFLLTKRYLKGRLILHWNASLLKAILKQSLPFSLVVLLMNIYTRIDAVMIERLLHDPITKKCFQGDVYAAAYRLLDAINMICFLFAGLLLPMFARMIKKKEDIRPLWKLSNSIMLMITTSFSVAVCFNAAEIMQFLMYSSYDEAMVQVLILLMIGFNSIGIIHIVGTLLTANGNLMAMNLVFLAGIVINVLSNAFLILEYGAWGAALSTIFTQSFVALAELELARRTFKVQWNGIFVLQVLLFITGVVLINWGLQKIDLHWFFRFATGGILAIFWALTTKILDAHGILSIFKAKAT